MYKKTVLDNGIKVVTLHLPQRQSVGIGVWVAVGGRYENFANKGIAHYLEHLVFKGSRKYDCRQIKESLEGVGGSLNGFTAEEFTCYLTKVPAKFLNLGLDVLSDMVFNPLLKEEDVEKERMVILEEIKMYKDLPQHYVQELLDLLLWPEHPLGESLTGSIETVSKIRSQDIVNFKNTYYNFANAVVAVCGGLEHSQVVTKIRNFTKGKSVKSKPGFVKWEKEQNAARVNLFFKETEQTHIALGFLGIKREHPDRHVLGLLNVILGANMSSRLFEEVREKRGLAYAVHSQAKCLNDTGCFIVDAGVDNQKVVETVEVILKELQRIKDEPVLKDELKRAKEFYAGQLMLALEDTLDHMLWMGEGTVSLDKVFTLKEILTEVAKINIRDIQRVANEILLGAKANLAIIGPLAPAVKQSLQDLILTPRLLK